MVAEKKQLLPKAVKNLKAAIKLYEKRKPGDELPFLTLCKALEVLVEYSWRELKRQVEGQGLFAPSPREAIKQAATIKLIDNPERWLAILTARNDSVHDYFGIPEGEYLRLAKELVRLSAELPG